MWIAISLVLLGLAIAIWLRARRAAQEADRVIRSLRKEVEAAREEHRASQANSQAHQLAIFNSMVEGILILDAEGRVRTINRSLERLFGVTEDFRGKSLMEAFRAHELLEVYERVQKEGVVRAYELTLPELNHTRYIEVNAAAIRDARGDSGGTILIFHDFTRIKELESVRKEFVANVSHELRTPLTLIKGYVETLIDGAKDDPAVATKFLHTIEKHTDRLTFLIEDLLNLSQLESGQSLLQRQVTKLFPLVEQVFEEWATTPQTKQKLENNVSPELLVNADADRLQQVLHNLVENAIKYGQPGGLVEVGAELKPEGVQVHVSDDGPGIPPEARERIFERFFRLDKARSREAGGTGLGLSIVKHIVQAHGGRVWVEPRPQGGSTFYFTLPKGGREPKMNAS